MLRAERAARGKCWIDGECAAAGAPRGSGWLSQDDIEDAYRRLGVRSIAHARRCSERL